MAEEYQYKNPVIFGDYSDPDVIRSGKYFYLVASSFNYVPGLPVLRSENLVEWEIVNYAIKKLPFGRFDTAVCRGDGVWAPSIRFHGGRYYCLVPFPDEGIYVTEAETPEGEWSPLRKLIGGCGLIDPCPIWDGDKCYVAVAFARTRAGFNSAIGVYEVTPDLTGCVSSTYKIVYDGHNDNPIIEGPKFYKRGKYFYILAPAGSVKSGWQVALRSENIYGPYESKVILMQGDSLVNGPHQGALVDAPDGSDWFIHFQDKRVYGRIVHLQPVTWQDGFPVCGRIKYDGLCGTPVEGGAYPVQIRTGAHIPECDDFSGKELSPIWQFPANPRAGAYSLGGGLNLFCVPCGKALDYLPCAPSCKLSREEFTAGCSFKLSLKEEGDEAGFAVCGRESASVSVVRERDGDYLYYKKWKGEEETVVLRRAFRGNESDIIVVGKNYDIYRLDCTFFINGERLETPFEAVAGVWVGARFALFARNKREVRSSGYATFTRFGVS